MEIKAKLGHLRIAPRKMRLVADLIRGKTAEEAKNILDFTVKKGALPFRKLLDQALANAKNNFQIEGNLYISKIFVDEGPKLKRWRPRSRGRAMEIQKKTSHLTLILEEKASSAEVRASKKGKAATRPLEKRKKESETQLNEPVEKKEKKTFKKKSPRSEKRVKTKGKTRALKRIFKRKSF